MLTRSLAERRLGGTSGLGRQSAPTRTTTRVPGGEHEQFETLPLQKLTQTYETASAVPSYLTTPLTAKLTDAGKLTDQPGMDQPKDKPLGAPDPPKAKPDDKDKKQAKATKEDAGKQQSKGTLKEAADAKKPKPAAKGGAGKTAAKAKGGEADEELQFVPPPLPAEMGPVPLYRERMELRATAPAFLAPATLAHRPDQPAKSLDDEIKNYSARFAEASGAARNLYDRLLSRMHALNEAARTSEDRRFEGRQEALDLALEQLAVSLGEARALLGRVHGEQLFQLEFLARFARRAIGGAASGGAKALDRRATKIDSDLAAPRAFKQQIVGLPAKKVGEIEAAHKEALEGLDELAAKPADKLKGTGKAKGKAMRAAQEEAMIRDIGFPVAEAKLRLDKSTKAITESVGKQSGPLDAALCPSFCPFEGFKTVLRGEAVKAVWSAHDTSLGRLKNIVETTRTGLDQSYAQAEAGLIEQHNQMRTRLIEAARQRDRAERDQARSQALRSGGGLAALAGAQSRAVTGIDETIRRRRGTKEEDFARTVIALSQGLTAQGIAATGRQQRQIEDNADDGQSRLDKLADGANLRFADGSRQSNALLASIAAQTCDANSKMIDGVADNLKKLDDPISQTVSGFLNRTGGQADAAVATLSGDLAKTRQKVVDGFAGPPKPAGDEGKKPDTKPANAKDAKPGKGGKGGKGNQPGKEDGPDPSIVRCQAACPKPEADAGPKDGKDTGKGDKTTGDQKGGAKQEYPDQYRDRLKGYKANPLPEPTVAEYLAAMPGIVETDLAGRANRLDKLLGYTDSDPNAVLNELRGLTRKQGAAVEEAYPDGSLREDLDWYLNAGNAFSGVEARVQWIFAARAYLNGDTPAGAMHELSAAVEWSNDSKQIATVLEGLTAEQMSQMKARFPKELKAVRDDLNELDGKVWDKLTAADSTVSKEQRSRYIGEAEALLLKDKITTAKDDYRGQAAVDKTDDALSESLAGKGSRLGGAPQFAEIERGYETRRIRQEQERRDLLAGFATIEGIVEEKGKEGETLLNFASQQHPYSVYVPGEGPNGAGGKWEVRTQASEAQKRLFEQLIKTGEGSPESRAARLAVELGRVGGPKPERVRTATEDMDLNEALGNPDAYKAAVERQKKMYELVDKWAPNPKGDGKPRSTEDIRKDVAERLAKPLAYDERKADYVKSLVTGGPGDAKSMVVRLDYAMEGAGTNNEVLKQTLASMTREQFQAVREEYDKQHPDGPDLLTRLGIRGKGDWWHSETSGDTANDLELLSIGIPRNDREKAEVAALQMKQQIRDAGALGPVVAGPEFGRLNSNYKRLMSIMGADDVDFDAEGNFVVLDADKQPAKLGRFDPNGKFVPDETFGAEDLALAMTVGKISAETYKAATDAVADTIATALVITAAIVTTALTGGAAASIWIPVLVTAAAGVAAMGVKYAIKGGRYGSEEMMFDLATTIIQAATAGIGAAAGTALRGGGKAVGALSKSWRMSEQALATAAAGGTKAATKALPALTFGQELFVGALSAGFAGGANAAINPDSYRSDNYATDILHGIIKGAIGGAVGAGVTRGVMGGVTSVARGMGARSGAAEALSKGMSATDASRFATARSRLFGTSALTEVGGRVLGSAASGMATRAVEIGYDAEVRGKRMSWGQFWNELGSAGLQNTIQAFGEGAIDRAIRARSRTRLREHAFTTRDDIHDYRQRGAQAVVDEGIRRGIIKPPATPDASASIAPVSRPTVAVDEQGRPLPLPRPDENGPGLPRPAADEEAAGPMAQRRADEDEQPLPPLRPEAEGEERPTTRPGHEIDAGEDGAPVRMHDPEVDGPLLLRTADKTITAANDNPGKPVHVKIALDPAAMVSMGRIPADSIFVHPDSKSLKAANDNYRALLKADPTREAAVYKNPVTGEYFVIQGGPGSVASVMHGEVKGLQGGARSVSRGGVPEERGHWVIEYHYHPNREGESGTHILRRLPSGATGDFAVLWAEMKMYGYKERTSRVHFDDNGVERFTEFGIRKNAQGQDEFWIKFPHPATGEPVSPPPFKDMRDYHTFLGKYLKGESPAEGGPVLPRTADRSDESGMTDPARRVGEARAGLDDRLSKGNLTDIDMISRRMGEEIGRDPRLPANPTEEQLYQALHRAQTPADVREAVAKMGLVGEPDSMVRLAALMADPTMQGPAGREKAERLARAVLDATQEQMRKAGTLGPGDELMMFFHGAPDGQIKSYQEKGVDMNLASPKGATEDLHAGSYSSQDLRSADRYLEAKGKVLPWIARRSELGNVLDLRSSSPLRARLEKFALANIGKDHPAGRIKAALLPAGIEALRQGKRPSIEHFNVEDRGVLFEAFRQSLANDPDPELRRIAANPDLVLADLGNPLTSGKSRGFVTDQAVIKSQRIADLVNEQLGFPRVGMADEPILRTADTETAKVEPAAPKKPPGIEPAHEDQALTRIAASRGGAEIVASIQALAAHDRPTAMAVLHAADEAAAKTALAAYRKALTDKGMSAEQAEIRARRLDFARASLGGRFRTEVDFAAGRVGAPAANLPPKLVAWIGESAVLRMLHDRDPALFLLLHDRFVAAKAGAGGRNRAPYFEKFVIRALYQIDKDLHALAGIRTRDDAVLKMAEQGHQIAAGDIVTGTPRPPSQSGPELTDPSTVQAGMRVDHPQHGRGTVREVTSGGYARVHFDGPNAPKPLIFIDGGGLKVAYEPDPRFDQIPPPIRKQAKMDEQFAKIADHRKESELPVYAIGAGETGTVARLELGGKAFHGTNSGLDPANFALPLGTRRELFEQLAKAFGLKEQNLGQAKFLSHAEAEALIRAYLHFGALPEVVELFVDRPTCPSCSKDLIRLARMLGVKELRIYYRGQSDPPLIQR